LDDSPLNLGPNVLTDMTATIGPLAARTVEAVRAEVAEYAQESGGLAPDTERLVALALGAFVRSLENGGAEASAEAMETAHALGRAEARAGRTMEALLAAFRVGARVAWRAWGSVAVQHEVGPTDAVRLAELVFAFIDQLSAASAAGHTAELGARDRLRGLQLARLGLALIKGEDHEALRHLAARAAWTAPRTLTAVLISGGQAGTVARLLGPGTLAVGADVLGDDETGLDVLLVADADRSSLLAALRGRTAVVGQEQHWMHVRASYLRAQRTYRLRPEEARRELVDTDAHLSELVRTADPEALRDLRAQVLHPFEPLTPAARERLVATLRAWLLHQGRQDPIATALNIHPQTVRYRVAQLRGLFGEQLQHPEAIFALTLAVGPPTGQP
jgi:hypothetical protein